MILTQEFRKNPSPDPAAAFPPLSGGAAGEGLRLEELLPGTLFPCPLAERSHFKAITITGFKMLLIPVCSVCQSTSAAVCSYTRWVILGQAGLR